MKSNKLLGICIKYNHKSVLGCGLLGFFLMLDFILYVSTYASTNFYASVLIYLVK